MGHPAGCRPTTARQLVAQNHGLQPATDEYDATNRLRDLVYEPATYHALPAKIDLSFSQHGLSTAYIFFAETGTAQIIAYWHRLLQALTTQHGPPHEHTTSLPTGITEADHTAFRQQLDEGTFIYHAAWEWPAPPPAVNYKLVLMLSGSFLLHLSLFVQD